MEHTRKMVLVPEEHVAQLGTQNQRQPAFSSSVSAAQTLQPTDTVLSRLDAEMNEILNSNAYKNEREKWGAYLVVLQRYLHFSDDERARQHSELMKSEHTTASNHDKGEKEEEARNGMNDSVIIESIPTKYRTKAKLLLRRLHGAPRCNFSWDSGGVVSIGRRPIQGSNIIDLVNDAMRARKISKPAGRGAFAKFLRAIQTPREFIGNEALWLETRANSTLRPSQIEESSNSSTNSGGGVTAASQSSFFSGRDSKSDNAGQSGNGYRNKYNKKRRVTWANLKL